MMNDDKHRLRFLNYRIGRNSLFNICESFLNVKKYWAVKHDNDETVVEMMHCSIQDLEDEEIRLRRIKCYDNEKLACTFSKNVDILDEVRHWNAEPCLSDGYEIHLHEISQSEYETYLEFERGAL